MKLLNPVHPDDLAAVRAWFDTLSKHCRAVDYEGARPIFAEDMIAFGTFTDFMIGRDLAEQKQWRNVWGTIRNFRYDLDKIEAIVSADRLTAVGMGVWQSDGFHPNGDRFDRPRPHHGDARPQEDRRSVRRHPYPHVAVPRHARAELRQVRLTPLLTEQAQEGVEQRGKQQRAQQHAGRQGEHPGEQDVAQGRLCSPERLANIVPATPEERMWVVLTGTPTTSAAPMVAMATTSADAPWA